jgi:ATP-dependent DNA helicase RecQ
MEHLYDARWQGVLQFHGAENCLLIECLYPLKELKLITKEQLGMQDFERQKNRQLDQMVLYMVTPECRQRVIRSYFGETVGNDYCCGHCDVCDPSLRSEVMADASVKKAVAQFLEQRETPELSGSYLDVGIALAFHTVVSRSEHIRTDIGERVYRFKYMLDSSQADWLASRAAKILEEKEFLNNIDLVVYVPGTQSDRPYEPVCLFAKNLCEQIDKPLICGLRKTRSTRPQKEMQTVEQKRRNVHGAFAVTQPKKVVSRKILLVDDLFDSGATVNECAKILKRAGAKKVYVLTLTKTTHVAR